MKVSSAGMRSLVMVCACIFTTATLAAGDDYNLPDMGQPADTALSPADEHKIGAQVLSQLRDQNAVIEDPELMAYINKIGDRLVRHTDRADLAFHFFVVDSSEINAFALPGGYVGINSGLITTTDNESQLASVMGHEIAHVTQRHIARQLEESRGDAIATMAAAILAAVAGAAAGASDAVPAAITAGISHLGQQQINYTRAHESEADRVGIHTVAASGFDPKEMARFFEKLQRSSDLAGSQLPQILLDHPVSTTRMAEAEARAAQYPNVTVRVDPEYPFMKERARVLQANSMTDLRNYYLGKLGEPDATPADHYGLALVLTQLGDSAKAVQILAPRAAAHPDQLAWTLALADAQAHAGHAGQAEQTLKAVLKRFPHSEPLQLAYAQSLQDNADPAAMRDYLLSQNGVLDNYPQAQQLLAQGASKQGNLGEAYFREARFYAMQDDYPQAINQLRTALQTAKLSNYDTLRLKAMRDQMVAACHEAWSNTECREGVKADLTY